MKSHALATIEEALAVRELTAQAEAFVVQRNRVKHLRNMGGIHARALKALVATARRFAAKSDEAWATEVAELRAELLRVYEIHRQKPHLPRAPGGRLRAAFGAVLLPRVRRDAKVVGRMMGW